MRAALNRDTGVAQTYLHCIDILAMGGDIGIEGGGVLAIGCPGLGVSHTSVKKGFVLVKKQRCLMKF